MITIRNLPLGDGIPKIAVPISPRGIGDAARLARLAASAGDFIELRVDSFEGILDADDSAAPQEDAPLRKLIRVVRREAGEVPVLFTFRTASEGGSAAPTNAQYAAAVRTAILSGEVDFIDIEAGHAEAETLLLEAHEGGIPVALSKHDFHTTPGFETIFEELCSMQERGADVAKCAFMPKTAADVHVVLAAQARARRELAIPGLVISMSERGLPSRLSAETFGAPFTFGCLPGEASAPGQIQARDLRHRLAALHRGKDERILFLTGFMGSGKSTVAAALAKRLRVPVLEMDREIELMEGMKIPQIFKDSGEERFRGLETGLLAELYEKKRTVVSCGGGVVLRRENVWLMRSLGTVVLLTAEPQTVLTRLTGEAENRPNIRERMTEEGIAELMDKRRGAYEYAADITVKTDGRTVDEICEEILSAVEKNVT